MRARCAYHVSPVPVAVVVAEVVRLPGARRQDDRDAVLCRALGGTTNGAYPIRPPAAVNCAK